MKDQPRVLHIMCVSKLLLLCIPVRYDLLYAVMCTCTYPYLHLPYSHSLLCEHSQRGVRPPGPHHIHGQAGVLKLLFRLQERVSIQPDVSLQDSDE